MKIEHIAIWTRDLERLKDFYLIYFDAQANEKYVNPSNGFESYFLSFASGPRVELMSRLDVEPNASAPDYPVGFTHLAFSVGSKERVDSLTDKLRQDDYKVVSEPRTTGDGYYESIIADPDGNLVEITI
ncbi:VOC family protein [Chloroflexota bacterium]